MKLKRNKAVFSENPAVNEEKPVGKKLSVWYILVAFIAAVTLWFYVADYDTVVEKTFIGVAVELIPPERTDLVVESGNGQLVDVTVKGKKADLGKMKKKDIRAYVDVSGAAQDGRLEANILVDLPHGVSLAEENSLSLTHVIVELSQPTVKELELKAYVASGSWESRYILTPECEPGKIRVTGTSSVIERVVEARVNIDVGNLEHPKQVHDKIVLLDKKGKTVPQNYIKITDTDGVEIHEAEVYVYMEMEKELPLKVEFTGGIFKPEDARIKCSPEYVTVRGSVEKLRKMESIDIPVDETSLSEHEKLSLRLPELPENVAFKSDVAETVEVKIDLINCISEELEFSVKDIKISGLPDGLAAKLSFKENEKGKIPSKAAVTVRGYRESVLTIRQEQLKAVELTVDFSEFKASEKGIKIGETYESMPITVSFPGLSGVFTTDRIEVRAEITEAPTEDSGEN